MASTQDSHQQFRDLLTQHQWDAAQAFWLELASALEDQPEFLLLLATELAEAAQPDRAAESAALLAPGLNQAGKTREWLHALKLQAHAKNPEKTLRAQVIDAYKVVYAADPRLGTILGVAQFDQPTTPLPLAIKRADALLALAENSFCQHKSWGFGRVKTFDAALHRLIVAFAHNPAHAFQLAYAAESLTPINHDHIEARKAADLPAVQQLAAADPLGLFRIVLVSHNRAATAAQIEAALAGSVIPADQWKKWWDNVRKLAQRDPHFDVPAKKTAPFVLRKAPVSQQDEILEVFREAISLAQKTAAARQLLKLVDELDNADLLLQEFHDGLLQAINRESRERVAGRLEAALVLEELLERQSQPTEQGSPLAAEILASARDLAGLLNKLSIPAQKRAIQVLKRAPTDRLTDYVNRLPVRALDELTEALGAASEQIQQRVQNQTASLELLFWLGRTINAPGAPAWTAAIPGPALLAAVFNAIENADTRSETKRLRDLLLNETTLLTELLAAASPDVVRDHARQVMASAAFEELDRRSLMARLVKEYPFVQELLISRSAQEQPLIVSKASFLKRQAELEELVQKKIPENSKEIGVARSYGDLRENFEFKAAKDMQRLLMRQRADLEIMLSRANPTEFAEVNTDSVQIGSSVTVTNQTTGQQLTYHVLGAWDGDPNHNILSYPAALAQALLNKKPGEVVAVHEDSGAQQLRIDRIEKVPDAILQKL